MASDPLVLVAVVVAGWAYARGTRALWRSAGRGRGVRLWQPVAFSLGLLAVLIALLSPLDSLADVLFSAHMAQHLILIAVAAPLLAAAGVPAAVLWSLSRPARVTVGRLLARLRWLRPLGWLPVAFAVHSITLWLWHAPPLYEGALRNAALHAIEHLALLGTGYLFWSAALHGVARATGTSAASVLFVFALGAQCTGLGALITLSSRLWYPSYATTTAAWGLSPMDDQVLAGALMWVPAGFVYLGLALLLLGLWLRPVAPISPRQAAPPRQPPAHLPGA